MQFLHIVKSCAPWHHVVPWRLGGSTALSDLALVCKHHHGIVEPAKYGTRDQWEVRIAIDGVPEFIPPARLDPQRRPMRHARFAARAGKGATQESMSKPQTAA